MPMRSSPPRDHSLRTSLFLPSSSVSETSPTTSPAPAVPPPWWRRLSAYSDLWTRYLDWAVRRSPHFWEGPLLLGYATGFYLAAGKQRRAIMDNLAVIRPREGRWRRRARAFGVFWEFSWMVLDSARSRAGERHVTWRLDGTPAFAKLLESGPALILTAHMGNYDVAAPFFAHRLGRCLHGVRVRERRPELQAYLENQRQTQESENFRVRYNRPGEFLGVELAQALAAGEIVAIQGDRVSDGVSSEEVSWNGQRWGLPRGPFVLAQASGAPVFPLFVRREGWRRYRIIVREPFVAWVDCMDRMGGDLASSRPAPRAERAAARARLVEWWANQLAGVLEASPSHWLMFERAFEGPATPGSLPEVRPAPLATRDEVRPMTPPVPQQRSTTPLGRWIDRALDRDWHLNEHIVPAEAPAQNPVETLLLTLLSLALVGCGAWYFLLIPYLSTLTAALVLPFTVHALFHLILLGCATVADAGGRWWKDRAASTGDHADMARLTEQLIFATLTGLAFALLRTPAGLLGAGWLSLAAANTILLVLGKATDALPKCAPKVRDGG